MDKNHAISSSALLAGIQLIKGNSDFIKKWTNEIVDRLNSKYQQNHFHAIILLHEIKKLDKNSFTKVGVPRSLFIRSSAGRDRLLAAPSARPADANPSSGEPIHPTTPSSFDRLFSSA